MKRIPVLIAAASTLVVPLAYAQSADSCLPMPKLAISLQSTTALRLDLAGEPGINYAIEQSDDLKTWTRGATNRSSTGLLSFMYSISPANPQRYYRALMADSIDGLGGSFIFDGSTFFGWDGDTTNLFRIANCAIVAGPFQQSRQADNYLCTTKVYNDFILRLEFKCVGSNINSGVQFRSARVPNSQQVRGYQADMGTGYWGSLYDQSGTRGFLATANQAAVAAVLKTNDWNSYVIQAEGARIQIWINGLKTIDYTETEVAIPRSGIIGLQIHKDNRSEVSFRRVSLEVLP